jgi:hypothetical protein
MDKAIPAVTSRAAMKRTLGSVAALLCTALASTLIQGPAAPADRIDRVDSSRRGVALPAPIRLTGLAAGDAIAADHDAPDWRCRAVCAL